MLGFWVLLAYIALAAAFVAFVVLFNRTAHEEAARAASAKSAATAEVAQCLSSSRNGPLVKGFANGFAALVENQIYSTQGALKAANPKDPLTPVRERALKRLFRAAGVAQGLVRLVDQTVPSMTSCKQLAARLHVPISR